LFLALQQQREFSRISARTPSPPLTCNTWRRRKLATTKTAGDDNPWPRGICDGSIRGCGSTTRPVIDRGTHRRSPVGVSCDDMVARFRRKQPPTSELEWVVYVGCRCRACRDGEIILDYSVE
jgi:hypothetical protein